MYDNELLENDSELDELSPLDDIPPVDTESEASKPNPDLMLSLLSAPETQQRMLAARAFCEIEDSRAIPLLIDLLGDPCPLVRVSAAYALGRNPSPSAVEPLIAKLDQDWNGYVRKGVVWALGNSHDRRTLDPLLDALKNDIPAVRMWAASALAQMAQLGYDVVVAAVPPLIQALIRDRVAAVRSNCAWSLGQLCRELPSNVVYAGGVDALIQVLEEDEDLGVREDAKAALLKLGDARGLQAIESLDLESDLEII
jgi:HEAT repeat protein